MNTGADHPFVLYHHAVSCCSAQCGPAPYLFTHTPRHPKARPPACPLALTHWHMCSRSSASACSSKHRHPAWQQPTCSGCAASTPSRPGRGPAMTCSVSGMSHGVEAEGRWLTGLGCGTTGEGHTSSNNPTQALQHKPVCGTGCLTHPPSWHPPHPPSAHQPGAQPQLQRRHQG